MRFARILRFATLAAFLSMSGSKALAGSNLVFDGDFEFAATTVPEDLRTLFGTGQLLNDDSWFVTQGIVGVDATDQYVFDGRGSLSLTIGTGLDAITQWLPTVAGQTYTISFYANADSLNQISVLFDGMPVSGAPTSVNVGAAPWPGTWTRYTATGLTRSTSTALTFEGASELPGQPSTFSVELDDISVVAAPEPASGLAFAVVGIPLLRRRRLAVSNCRIK
ncbi:MAG TPA: hypothetical protein VK797_08125 [Tepidisphaeraceae bacterium]|nr:hypothetical protein [Tepidisphaeraceae bacterium]